LEDAVTMHQPAPTRQGLNRRLRHASGTLARIAFGLYLFAAASAMVATLPVNPITVAGALGLASGAGFVLARNAVITAARASREDCPFCSPKRDT
jgi:hypothetical protein